MSFYRISMTLYAYMKPFSIRFDSIFDVFQILLTWVVTLETIIINK